MRETDIEVILERTKEKYPEAKPRIISDNGPQFIARDFKEFIRISGMTHVRTSPYYPQSNGKIERWHKSLKSECIRPATPVRAKASLCAMMVDGWLARAAAARPGHRRWRPPRAAAPTRELLRRRARRRGASSPRAAPAPERASRSPCRRARLRAGAARVPAARRGRGARRPAALRPPSGARSSPAARSSSRSPSRGSGAASRAGSRPPRSAPPRHDLDATAVVIHTSGTQRRAAGRSSSPTATCCGARSARPSRSGCDRRRALAVRAAAVARRRALDPAALGDLRDHRGRARALRGRPRRCDALREQEVTLVSLVATTLARLLDAGLQRPPALRCALTGGGPVPAALLRARARGGRARSA